MNRPFLVDLGALSAATAATHHHELKTLNTKHYPMILDLAPAYQKS